MLKNNKLIKKYNSIPIAAKATLWFMICNILQKSISLITTPIFTRIMSTTQYGQFSIYNSWYQIFIILTTLRLNYAVFNKGMSKYKEDRDAYTSTMQTLTFCITIVFLALYLIFYKQVNLLIELPTFIMLAMFMELLFIPAIYFWTVRKRYEYVYKPIVIVTLAMTVLNASLGVLAVFLSSEKGYARILTCVAVDTIFGLSIFIYNRKKGKVWFKKEYAIFAITFNLPLLLHYFSQYVLDQFDRIMIQKMESVAAAGIYSVAYNAGLIMKIVTQSVNNALVPWQYEQLEKKEFKRFEDIFFYICILVAAISVMFSAFAPEIMMILADEKYQEAKYVIPPVALGMFFLFMYTSFANVEFFFDQNKFTMYISMFGAVLNVGLNYVGIKMFGYVAAAYTTLFCYIVFCFSHYIYMTISIKKKLGIDKVFNSTRFVILSAVVLIFGLSIVFFYDMMLIRYCIILVLLGIMFFNRSKIIEMFKMIKRKKK